MRSRPSQGFLLLEVILALAVLVGATITVFVSIRSSLHDVERSRDFFHAALLLEDRVGVKEKSGRVGLSMEDDALGPVLWREEILPSNSSSWHLERWVLEWGSPNKQDVHAVIPIHDET